VPATTTKRLLLAGAVGIALLAGLYFWLHIRRSVSLQVKGQPEAATGNEIEEFEYVAAPYISMRINGTHEPVVAQGTPLLVSLRAANQGAMNAQLINQAHKQRWAALQEKLSSGQVQKEEVNALAPSLQHELPVKTVQLGSESGGWEQFVRFVQRLPGGKEEPLPWKLDPIGASSEKKLVLDAETTVQLDFGLTPEAAAAIAPGDYEIVGILEVPASASVSAEQWKGRSETDPVTLKVLPQQPPPSAADRLRSELDAVKYFLVTNQSALALQHAKAALAAGPTDIDAQIALGDSKAAQNDPQGGLAAYQAALQEFQSQSPAPYEPPSLLFEKISKLRKGLKTKPQ